MRAHGPEVTLEPTNANTQYGTAFCTLGYLERGNVYFCPAMEVSDVGNSLCSDLYFRFYTIGMREAHGYSTPASMITAQWFAVSFKKIKASSRYFIFADTSNDKTKPHKRSNPRAQIYSSDDYVSVYEAHNRILNATYLDGHTASASGMEFIREAIQNWKEITGSNPGTRAYLDYNAAKNSIYLP